MINWLLSIRKELTLMITPAQNPGRLPFLRRAEEEGWLLVSDAPRRLYEPDKAKEQIKSAGFLLLEKDRLWYMDAPLFRYEALAETLKKEDAKLPERNELLPVWALVRLTRLHPCPTDVQPVWALRSVLKAVEEGEKAVCGLAGRMMPAIAVSLRKKEPIPALAGDFLNAWLLDISEKEH